MRITIELTRPTWLGTPRSRKALTVLLAVLLTVGVPTTALATHLFADVPTTSIFHNAISAVAGAGITTGCGGGLYCPSADVTREQMAAFLHRGLGRIGVGTSNEIALTGTTADVSVLTMKAGEVSGGTVLIKVDAVLTTFADQWIECPCRSTFFISQDGGTSSPTYFSQVTESQKAGIHTSFGTYVFAVPSGTTQTFRLKAGTASGSAMRGSGQLTAVYAPFSGQ